MRNRGNRIKRSGKTYIGCATIIMFMIISLMAFMVILIHKVTLTYKEFVPFEDKSITHIAQSRDRSAGPSSNGTALTPTPPWEKLFWTPIDVESVSTNPVVILCRLNFKEYSASPHTTPMFKILVQKSRCNGDNRRKKSLKSLLVEIQEHPATESSRFIPPNGFVFHESRVGSTLVANFMASSPYSMVFSESQPMATALLHCDGCSREYHVQLFRDVTTLMGRSPFHTHLFFKFQSITVTQMSIALEAFPDTPWAFVYRDPVQTMMSHMDPAKGGGGEGSPCMRSKRRRPKEVLDAVRKYKPTATATATGSAGAGGRSTPNELWCAAHLNMLCSFALQNLEKFGNNTQMQQRGLLLNYESLPGIVPTVLLPHFGVPQVPSYWLQKITEESGMYSKYKKGRSDKSEVFTGDSVDKTNRATALIQQYANLVLRPTYDQLLEKGMQALRAARPELVTANVAVTGFDWKQLSGLPTYTTSGIAPLSILDRTKKLVHAGGTNDSFRITIDGHSHAIKEVEYDASMPFGNHHSSRTFQPAYCPLKPEPDYPQAFSMIDITNNWNVDSTIIPPRHYDSLCHFDYQNTTQRQQSYNYRAAEKPYVVYNYPPIDEAVKKWSDINYLSKLLGKKRYRTETSYTNHFMYWSAKRKYSAANKNWKPPTGSVQTTFDDWLRLAILNHNKSLSEREHQYFRVSATERGSRNWLAKELPFFKAVESLLMVDPTQQKGIHCRFGMRSVIAEAHFDGARNSVVELGGMRRWILTHPDQCENMHMYLKPHPSGRHSAVDWSAPDLEQFPNFAKIKGNEVILVPGDFLFIPTNWIHTITSLNINVQCNSRSGYSSIYDPYLHKCGFRTSK